MTLNGSLQRIVWCGLAVLAIDAALVVGEMIGSTATFQRLRHDIPITLLRIAVFSVTVLPTAFLAGRAVVRRSPASRQAALACVGVTFALVIGLFQIFV